MKCSHCGKEIILSPSAKERAKKFGGVPSDYTKLFTIHPQCLVEKRNQMAMETIKKPLNSIQYIIT